MSAVWVAYAPIQGKVVPGVQSLESGQGVVLDGPRSIGCSLQRRVVDDDDFPVAALVHVEFHQRCAIVERPAERDQSILRSAPHLSPMADDSRFWLRKERINRCRIQGSKGSGVEALET